jgi:hypothetical protein
MRTELESSLLKSYEYDGAAEILTLEFQEGNALYDYLEFTAQDFTDFLAAKSKGKHFLKVIKPNFQCEKRPLEENEDAQKPGEQQDNRDRSPSRRRDG